MAAFGFLVHPYRPLAGEICRDLIPWLIERHHEVRLLRADAAQPAMAGLEGVADLAVDEDEFAPGLDLIVGVGGGDGTMLNAMALAGNAEVPVLEHQRRATRVPHDRRAQRRTFCRSSGS